MRKRLKIKRLIIAAALSCLMMTGGIAAYSTASDSETNCFTMGSVSIELSEPHWESISSAEQGRSYTKDPIVTNTGDNAAYVFAEVMIPVRNIYTCDPDTGERNSKADTELVQLNGEETAAYGRRDDHYMTPVHTEGMGWTILESKDAEGGYAACVYAYGSRDSLTRLAPGAATEPAFRSVTFCNAVEGQGLDDESFRTDVTAYAIQADDITGGDESSPAEVWRIIRNQAG